MKLLDPQIIDTTLRDGEQTPGVVFTIDQKLRIAENLNVLGVEEVEAGTPAIGSDEQEAIRQIAGAGFSFVTSCWCRAHCSDIKQAASLGTQSINISLPVSDIQIQTLGKSREWVMSELRKTVKLAKSLVAHVTLGAQDSTRAADDFLNEFIFYGVEAGADRIRIADTVGISDPIEIHQMFVRLKQLFADVKFEFHGHNDFGMATANAIAAIKGGADTISGTINGIGERAGNAAIEEIIAWLGIKNGFHKYQTKIIPELSAYIELVSKNPVAYSKPIVGKNVFAHESGIHTSAIVKNSQSYQILNPKDFGINSWNFVIGKHSGKASILNYYNEKGLSIDDDLAKILLTKIKDMVSHGGRSLSEEQLVELYKREINNQNFINSNHPLIFSKPEVEDE